MTRKRYSGPMPRIIHGPAEYVVGGYPASVCAACRVYGNTAPERLKVALIGGADYSMLPYDRFEKQGIAYQLYRADIPATVIVGDSFAYTIEEDGRPEEKTEVFECPILPLSSFPELPPLVITEIFGRPKGSNTTAFIEFLNPTVAAVDLYDYEVLVYANTDTPEDKSKPTGRLPLANEPGKNIIGAGEFAAVWGIRDKNYDPLTECLTVEQFKTKFGSEFLYKNGAIDFSRVNVLPVDYTCIDPESGVRKHIDGICAIPERHHASTLMIVPRGGEMTDAVFRLVYSYSHAEWDTPVQRSSYWTIDIRNPRVGKNISHADLATPGYPSYGQAAPDLSASLPIILPISPLAEAYHGDYECTFEFVTVPTDDGAEAVAADVHVILESGEEVVLAAKEEHDGIRRARLPEKIFETLSFLDYYITVTDGTRTSIFAKTAPIHLPVYDNKGPRITYMYPTRGYAYDGTKPTPINIKFFDISGLRAGESYIKIDGKDVTSKAVWSANSVDYEPEKAFSVGHHTLELRLKDGLGNRTTRVIDFSVSDMTELDIYFGEIHAHTGESDGTGLCRDAIEFAREAGSDFFSVTEHSHYINDRVYEDQKKAADEYDRPGSFAALYGWEMTWNNTCGYWGHMNIIGSDDYISDIDNNSMLDVFRWFDKEPRAVGMFNHPGAAWGDFESYAYRTKVADDAMCLAEIKGRGYDRPYALMLSRGWHTAPTFNEDNHSPNWTIGSPYITGVIAPALTRENIMDAFRARRTYSSADPTLKIFYKVNGEWLGSRLDAPEKLEFSIRISTENELGIGLIEIVGEDNIVVASRNAGALQSIEWNPTLPVEFDYYYLRISNEKQYSVTAPVWIENRGNIRIDSVGRAASCNTRESAAITVKLTNPTEIDMTEIKIDYYLCGLDGFSLRDAVPYCTAHIGKLRSGRSAEAIRQIPELAKMRRVSILVTAMAGKKKVRTTAYINATPLSITEVLNLSDELILPSGEMLNNPFPYITICNSSCKSFDLASGKLMLWTVTGKPPQEGRIFPTDGITVKARSTAVIWYRSPSAAELTVSDFNARYGTELVEGEDIFICDKPIVSTDTAGRRLDLSICGEVVARVTWNMGLRYGQTAPRGQAYKYCYIPDMEPLAKLYDVSKPTPGAIEVKQKGKQLSVVATKSEIRNAKRQNKKDDKREKRLAQIKYTSRESAIIAAGVATAAAGIAAVVAKAFTRKKK